jgi:chromosome segregation ATPase
MGCSQSKEAAILGLKEEIIILQRKKSSALLELDSLKVPLTFYAMTEEEKNYTLKIMTQENENLQKEHERLKNLSSQIEDLSKKIEHLDWDINEKKKLFDQLEITCERKKTEYLKIVEECSQAMHESTDLSFEHSQKSKSLQSMSSARIENENLQEKLEMLQESLTRLEETESKISENHLKISELESKIQSLEPLIKTQNDDHSHLLSLSSEIKEKTNTLSKTILSKDEQQYQSELYSSLSLLQKKHLKVDYLLNQLNTFNIDDLKSSKDSQMLVRQTLKSELKSLITPSNATFFEVCKHESKKSSLQLYSLQKTSELESNYSLICNKIQRKESEKASLERQLKEYQDILKDLEFE